MKQPQCIRRLTAILPARWRAEFGRLLRFGITGAVSTLVHYGAYCLVLLWTGPTPAYAAGYGVAMICNYILTTFFTFRQRPSKANAAGFVASHAVNFLLEIVLLNLFLWAGAGKHVAAIATMAVAIPANFAMLHVVYLYRRKR